MHEKTADSPINQAGRSPAESVLLVPVRRRLPAAGQDAAAAETNRWSPSSVPKYRDYDNETSRSAPD